MTRKNNRRERARPGGQPGDRLDIEVRQWLAAEAQGDDDSGAAQRALGRVFRQLPVPGPNLGFAERVANVALAPARRTTSRLWLLVAATIVAAISLPLRASLALGALAFFDTTALVGFLATMTTKAEAVAHQVGAVLRVVAELGPTLRGLFWSPPVLVVLAIFGSGLALGIRRMGAAADRSEVGFHA